MWTQPVIIEDEKAIKLWKKLGVDKCEVEFSCGGDSMGDLDSMLYDKDGVQINNDELVEYFNNVVYDKVEFYVNSDGYYQGESGKVHIDLDTENEFTYSKDSESEYSETTEVEIFVPLNDKQVAFIKEKVSNINGGNDDVGFNYNGDHILTDEEDVLMEEIGQYIDQFVSEYPYDVEGELSIHQQFLQKYNLT